MTTFSSLRARVVAILFLVVTPILALVYFHGFSWRTVGMGLLVVAAAYLLAEGFVLWPVRRLLNGVKRLSREDYAGSIPTRGQVATLAEIAEEFDVVATKLRKARVERDALQNTLLTSSLRQTVLGALGQLALTRTDIASLQNQAVMLVSQTLEVEFCAVFGVEATANALRLEAGVGWNQSFSSSVLVPLNLAEETGLALDSGEPVITEPGSTRSGVSPHLVEHGVKYGATVAVTAQSERFGVLGAYTAKNRPFTGDEVNFLLSVGALLGMAAARAKDEAQRLSLQAQLFQSQKMESIGQLAAGVAHDFNNMLTVIQGHSGMILSRETLEPRFRESLQAISFASERAANLTRQLLMFSRKSVMQPKEVDLRQLITQLVKMLQRLVGAEISISVETPHELPCIHADTGMIEQVIMNLTVNARDAMAEGGKILISTYGVHRIDAVPNIPESRAGAFVCLKVADTGCGMDLATQARIFEPFFTTKEIGKGTGLGLATVYGIVKQHEGWIEVQSALGEGTTFEIFFPAQSAPVPQRSPESSLPQAMPRGSETILLVEDEQVLRDLANAILEECGYCVLNAGSGPEALAIWEANRGKVDLLLTDLIMPAGVSGTELAQRLRQEDPDLRLLFATGYSIEEVHRYFGSDPGARFLQKPFTNVSLARAVRECLDQPPAAA